MRSIELRKYQSEVMTRLQSAVANGARRVLLVAPTGAGKTVIASAPIAGAVADGKPALIVAHRRELIDQAYRKLDDAGLCVGIILAHDHRSEDDAPVQVPQGSQRWPIVEREGICSPRPAAIANMPTASFWRSMR